MFSIVGRDILICSTLKKQFNPSITKAILGPISDLRTREDKTLSKKLRRIVKKYGGDDAYALVTGAGDGIGREQALEMARNGMNLILVSRSEDKLVQVGKECERINPNITITIRSCDFSKAEAKDYKAFFESDKIKGKNLRILVNNVGQIDRTKFFDLTPD